MRFPTEWLVLSDSEQARFDSKVSPDQAPAGCHLWIGGTTIWGYGFFNLTRAGTDHKTGAHRVAAVRRFGAFDTSLVVDHICHVKPCVNPEHLRVATHKQNGENRAGASSVSASGLRGVYWVPRDRRWIGEAKHHGKQYRTRPFHTMEEADEAVRALRLELFTHSQETA